MNQTRVALVGASGRMGKEISAIIEDKSDMAVSAKIDQSGEGLGSLSDVNPKEVDVVIDFSRAENFSTTLNWCVENNIKLVSGVTGLNEKDREALDMGSKKIPILWAANMSVGVAIMNKCLELFGSLGGDSFDYQLEEIHHKNKIDSPSGTAKYLQGTLERVLQKKMPEVLAVRGGGVFGVHKLWAISEEEVLTIEHQALNRKVFAKGAVVAANWIQGQGAGKHTMEDALGLS